MKIKAIIQARYCATRLPGKMLLKILDKTVLEYVIERVARAKNIKGIVVATTLKDKDLQIADLADNLNIPVYRGSEDDVLDRFYQAAMLFGMRHIVRITADCPLMDPRVIDDVIGLYFKSGADYCSNVLETTFPDGEDVEVFNISALKDAWENARLLSEREHVTSYIKNHPDKFKLVNFKHKIDISDKRWTLDTKKDFKLIKAVLEAIYPENPGFSMGDVLNFLERNPHIENINKGIKRNEGYLESLKKDKKGQ